jgi:hypothetical protein
VPRPVVPRSVIPRPLGPAAGLALVIAIAALAPRDAAAEDLPPGRLGIVAGVRSGTGELADAFGLGAVFGFEAGWQPMSTEDRVGFAARWSVLWSSFDVFGYGADPESLTGSLRVLQLDAGARIRVAPRPGTGGILSAGFGVTALRSNVPLPPDQEREYVGGYGAGGIEYLLTRRILLSVEVRYGLIFAGPGAVDVLIGVATGV